LYVLNFFPVFTCVFLHSLHMFGFVDFVALYDIILHPLSPTQFALHMARVIVLLLITAFRAFLHILLVFAPPKQLRVGMRVGVLVGDLVGDLVDDLVGVLVVGVLVVGVLVVGVLVVGVLVVGTLVVGEAVVGVAVVGSLVFSHSWY